MKNTILCGDCRYIFPKIKHLVDYVISDPPYNIEFNKYNEYEDNLSSQEYINLLNTFQKCKSAIIQYPEEMMRFVVPALGLPDEVMAWCYNSNISKRFRLINTYNCIPDYSKVKQPYKNPNDKRVKKLIEGGSEGTNLYDWFSDIQIVKNVSREKTIHPCPIPEALAERLILLLTNEGDTICDPFMGSGTVAVAAKKLNRNYIGIELSQQYCDISNQRLNNIGN